VTLTARLSDPPLATPHSELLDFESPLLSELWGRPIHIRGLVVLPPSYSNNPFQKYPVLSFRNPRVCYLRK
jgi:hypothetical protein